ncbi:hypothetical protein [Bradyrhizobium sp. WSM471]|uniref:hypothetical protein n=1 Tax=Bradyrhizobium sp. WSM471 TaxID=319017 RepID=UPI0002D4A3AE|nr:MULTISPECIES: hypothetical protein [Bradyrhizobium]UFW41437.1 hypothetical protein BcanWSM471_35475 [Bradyrhizobium canariense]
MSRFRAGASDETFDLADEVIFPPPRRWPETMEGEDDGIDQQRSSIMWDNLFSLIYRLSCRATLIEIGMGRSSR